MLKKKIEDSLTLSVNDNVLIYQIIRLSVPILF